MNTKTFQNKTSNLQVLIVINLIISKVKVKENTFQGHLKFSGASFQKEIYLKDLNNQMAKK